MMIKINGQELVTSVYPNGEMKIDLKDFVTDEIKEYEIKWKYESDSEIIQLAFITDYIKEKRLIRNVSLHILYMPYSRMDRSENGSVFTLKTMISMIKNMWISDVYVYEAHSEVTKELFGDEGTYYHEVNLTDDLLLKAIRERSNKSIPYVVFFPDKGAKARYNKGNNFYLTGAKKRDFETGKITSYEIEDADKVKKDSPFEVFIVDDLCSYGGTFVEASKKLYELGATNITLIVAHAEESIMKGELLNYVSRVYTTNSIINESNGWEQRSEDGLTSYPIYIKEII